MSSPTSASAPSAAPAPADDVPVIGVLALQGDVREHLAALAAAGAPARSVRRPEELAEVAGLVIPGGESTTMSKLAVIFGLLEPLRERVRAGMPVYGTCAGMIMVADKILDGRDDQETVGGIDMIVRRNAFGRQNESFEAGIDVKGIDGGPVEGVFIRAPWVESVGAAAEVLATFDGHTVAVRQDHVLATSFHPELTGDHRVHALFVEMVRQSLRG
ncbi:pyridoxal 5'-phosphate synthase glutaminase subunit PdxT [Streptomyces cucumeris]|uniref:pyridoxal 5'-phosphate synthase glutaminase subunit PdxT n=1 Tax=Streptomyces cucumeris TaxID=2962890 RepID=UPI0020C8CEDF|nr:pyridoxal 5'-phosphate synthase glutaminase subunit PdxT [Streptomyces sp. NEAU-Y11]MCP9208049.1 pyridoxal 5'-phosphate synthase glutaminase subunit PdxT [Streptomyces sp. NEAU-Y11]